MKFLILSDCPYEAHNSGLSNSIQPLTDLEIESTVTLDIYLVQITMVQSV